MLFLFLLSIFFFSSNAQFNLVSHYGNFLIATRSKDQTIKKKNKLYEVERRGNFVKIPTNFILKTFLVNVVEFVVYFESL